MNGCSDQNNMSQTMKTLFSLWTFINQLHELNAFKLVKELIYGTDFPSLFTPMCLLKMFI